MMAALLMPPSELSKSGNLADNWYRWKQSFELYLIASQTDQSDNTTVCALFLHTIGQFGRDLYNDITCLNPASEYNLEQLYQLFENHFNPKSNLTINRLDYFRIRQGKNEPFDKFLSRLQQQSKYCEFAYLTNSLIITQIITGINNNTLRERLLRFDYDLHDVIEECRTAEKFSQYTTLYNTNVRKTEELSIGSKVETGPNHTSDKKEKPYINKCRFCGGSHIYGKCSEFVKKQNKDNEPIENIIYCVLCNTSHAHGKCTIVEKKVAHFKEAASNIKSSQSTIEAKMIMNCKFCGDSHLYGRCPAFGKACTKCGELNHTSRVCKSTDCVLQ